MDKLKFRTLLCLLFVFAFIGFGTYSAIRSQLESGFARVELRDARLNLSRVRQALLAEQHALNNKMSDWAAWDDTYQFIRDANAGFVGSNLNASTVGNLMASYVVFLDTNRRVVFGKRYVAAEDRLEDLPADVVDFIAKHPQYTQLKDVDARAEGFVEFADGLHYATFQPIVTSEGKGPVRGTVFVTRAFDKANLEKIAKTVHLSLEVEPKAHGYSESVAAARGELASLDGEPAVLRTPDAERLQGYTYLKDINGAELFALRASQPREIYREGQATLASLRQWMFWLCGGGLGFIAIALLALVRRVNLSLVRTSRDIRLAAQKLDESSTSLAGASEGIRRGSDEQSQAILKTATASDQMLAMVEKISEEARRSQSVAEASADVAERSVELNQGLAQKIREIESANGELSATIQETQGELRRIASAVREVAQKTQVINDIVFQTKLLSFNASVEAARSGEAGKGFAVVAEEVGNLAQMSGQASVQISKEVDSATEQIDRLVGESERRLSAVSAKCESSIRAGVESIEGASAQIVDLKKKIGEVLSANSAILESAREELEGIQDIRQAVSTVTESLRAQREVAESTSTESSALRERVELLDQAVDDLNRVIGLRKAA